MSFSRLTTISGGKKVIASSLNEYALGPREEHLSLSIQRSDTASVVGDIGSPSLLSYLSHPGWARLSVIKLVNRVGKRSPAPGFKEEKKDQASREML
ncbi:hypothetical protein RND71_015925 [Anisodus tanguticus]|uniref:Uncharacterized protein n=1 Tax=Anisodus tanguticus TaxID=243964 RepID=A0AAE1VDB1_9SOLA|nr:hypothetical protein RND71_015925 [Anisodus tanguticus]